MSRERYSNNGQTLDTHKRREADYRLRMSDHIVKCVSPRMIILDQGRNTLMVYHNGWYGFPGGNMQQQEFKVGMDFMNVKSYETLAREFAEETGISPQNTQNIMRYGYPITLTRVAHVDNTARQIRAVYSPMYLALIEDVFLLRPRPHVLRASISELPPNIFPDAQQVLEILNFDLRQDSYSGLLDHVIEPPTSFFQTHPVMKPLCDSPEWLPEHESLFI